MTAVERNNQTCRLLIILRRLHCINLIKTSQILNKNDVKPKDEFHFSEVRGSMNAIGSGVTYFARDPSLRSYFHEPQKNEIYFLNDFPAFRCDFRLDSGKMQE